MTVIDFQKNLINKSAPSNSTEDFLHFMLANAITIYNSTIDNHLKCTWKYLEYIKLLM